MYGPVQFRLPFFVRPDSHGFAVTCPEIPFINRVGVTEEEAIEQATAEAVLHFQSVVSKDDPLPDGPFNLRGPNANLESAIGEILETLHPGEGYKVRIEEVWLDALQ